MKSLFQSKPAALTSAHGFTTLFNVEIPVPALQRGWLHGREFVQPWQVECIAARIGEHAWFSQAWQRLSRAADVRPPDDGLSHHPTHLTDPSWNVRRSHCSRPLHPVISLPS